MSCAALCKQREMKHLPVILMWAFLCLMTGVVAMATAWVFTNERISDESLEFYRIKEVRRDGSGCQIVYTVLVKQHEPQVATKSAFDAAKRALPGSRCLYGVAVLSPRCRW